MWAFYILAYHWRPSPLISHRQRHFHSLQVLVWHTQTAKADLKMEKLMEQKGKPATNVGIEV